MGRSRLETAAKSGAHALAVRLMAPSQRVPVPARPERILVTKQHNQMGDFILASPLIANLARRFPGAAIDVLASPVQAEVAGLVPEVRRVWLLDAKGVVRKTPRLLSLVRAIRRERYDLAIAVFTVSYSSTTAIALALSGARFRAAGRIADSPRGRGLFHREVAVPSGCHETDRALAHLAAIGLEPETRVPRLAATPEEVETARLLLAALGWRRDDFVIAVHPGAGKKPNRWPAPRFGEVVRRALGREGTRVLLLAGPGEETLLDEMNVPAGARVARMTGFPLRQVAALLQNASLYLGNDTGTLHLASAVGLPTFGLYGPTDPALWAPASDRARSLRAEAGDLARLTVEAVDKQLENMFLKHDSEKR